jgi:DNA-binding GntR family transcriptional regulator
VDGNPRKVPTHEVVYGRLRDMVLFGDLAPGQAVTIQGLCTDLGAGMTPVREAIRRLSAEGALVAQDNRRVGVPVLTVAHLDQLAFARVAIEPHLAGLAVRGGAALADRLVALDAGVDRAIAAGDVHDYLEANHAFHFALYAASGAAVLVEMAAGLWLRFGPSLREVLVASGGRIVADHHKEAIAALRAGDAEGVARAMRADIGDGVAGVRAALR